MLALCDYCLSVVDDVAERNTSHAPVDQLVWFLDSDIVLRNPLVNIETIWHYYYSNNNDKMLDALFAADTNELNSGMFLLNCSSPTARRLYCIGISMLGTIQNKCGEKTARCPFPTNKNTMHWLLQSNVWKSQVPLHPRTDELVDLSAAATAGSNNNNTKTLPLNDASSEERALFSVSALAQRVLTVDQVCGFAVFPIEFIFDAVENECYRTRGPYWYEEGQFAVHTAGIRKPSRRLPYLQSMIVTTNDVGAIGTVENTTTNMTKSLQDAAREYLERYGQVHPQDPTNGFDYKAHRRKRRMERRQKQQAREKQQSYY